MIREAKKALYEREVFERFLNASGIEIVRASIRQGDANMNQPDILCQSASGKWAGFELGRIVDPNLISAKNQWEPEDGRYIRTSDPSPCIARKKIQKTYDVPFPVELLLYKELPVITPDNVIIPTIQAVCHLRHQYHRVWYMGDSVKVLFEHR